MEKPPNREYLTSREVPDFTFSIPEIDDIDISEMSDDVLDGEVSDEFLDWISGEGESDLGFESHFEHLSGETEWNHRVRVNLIMREQQPISSDEEVDGDSRTRSTEMSFKVQHCGCGPLHDDSNEDEDSDEANFADDEAEDSDSEPESESEEEPEPETASETDEDDPRDEKEIRREKYRYCTKTRRRCPSITSQSVIRRWQFSIGLSPFGACSPVHFKGIKLRNDSIRNPFYKH